MKSSTNIAANSSAQAIDIKSVIDLVSHDMTIVDQILTENLDSDVALIKQLGAYIVQAGGKRLRPVSLLLAAKACSSDSNTTQENAPLLAAIVEFIHTATLLHDDVVDESEMRRGRETANEVFGNAASVLVGDFLYSRAFQMMIKADSMRVMEILSHTTNQIAEGEVMQLLNIKDAETTEERYMAVIQSKTAILFEAACRMGAVLGDCSEKMESALAAYGTHLGTAFQLIDDVLDYEADQEKLGKEIGNDLAEGKPTLPLIHAMRIGSAAESKTIRRAIEEGNIEMLADVMDIIRNCESLEYTRKVAAREADYAIAQAETLPESSYTRAMINLANLSIQRSS